MKYFVHLTGTDQDPKIQKLRLRFGFIGKAIYFELLEVIAEAVDTRSLIEGKAGFPPDGWDTELFAGRCQITEEKLNEIFDFMASPKVNLIDQEQWEKNKKIFVPKVIKNSSDYLKKLIKQHQKSNSAITEIPKIYRNIPHISELFRIILKDSEIFPEIGIGIGRGIGIGSGSGSGKKNIEEENSPPTPSPTSTSTLSPTKKPGKKNTKKRFKEFVDFMVAYAAKKAKLVIGPRQRSDFIGLISTYGLMKIKFALDRWERYKEGHSKRSHYTFAIRFNRWVENIEIFLSDENLEKRIYKETYGFSHPYQGGRQTAEQTAPSQNALEQAIKNQNTEVNDV